MGRKKIQIAPPTDALGEEIIKELEIESASIKDDYCEYFYKLLTGVGKGDSLKRTGSSVIHHDLKKALDRLDVHLAIIDGSFRGEESDRSISDLRNDNIVHSFRVNGFSITGSEENQSVIISGNKWVKNGNISIKTPKISLTGSYEFLDDLSDAIIHLKSEVEKYMNGKCDEPEPLPEFDFPAEEEDTDFNAENAL